MFVSFDGCMYGDCGSCSRPNNYIHAHGTSERGCFSGASFAEVGSEPMTINRVMEGLDQCVV